MLRLLLTLCLLLPCTLYAAEISSPEQANIDSKVTVTLTGEVAPRAFVSIVAPDTPEGEYGSYAYARSATVVVPAPEDPGDYEVRLHGAEAPYSTLARRPIRIVVPEATLEAPAEQPIGTAFSVQWSGPSGANEYITLVPADAADGAYDAYEYARGDGQGSVTLTTPATPGDYEVRYMTGSKNRVIARHPLRVGDSGASVTAPATVGMGARFDVAWTGPDNARNFITVVPPDAAERTYDEYGYTRTPTVTLVAPEAPGQYEVRLLSADGTRVLARAPLQVQGAEASVKAPASVQADSEFKATWTGPDNDLDYIGIIAPGKPGEYVNYTYTRRGSPLVLRAPKTPGDYEVHYFTGRSNQSLARQTLKVTPADTPGRLQVVAGSGPGASAGAGTVELILDASGSMLQRLGGERRIDIARRALADLVSKQLPADSRVALRVFGHRKPDACDTELLAPLAPLDRAGLAARVRGIEAKNLAKTPIAASLAAVAGDLAGTEGSALVVLVTDGEETCGGDPAAEIRKLKQAGFAVSLNIVGFAIDEYALEQEFREWARLGGGAYFHAGDAAELARGVAQASQPATYSVLRGETAVASGVVGNEAITLPPGRYEVQVGGQRRPVTITAGEDTVLDLSGQ